MDTSTRGVNDRPAFLDGGGAMGALMRDHDWTRTALGAPETWPQALRTVVRLMLNTGHPMYIFWGPTGACLYNDAYRRSIGPERHPQSLGQPAREVWDEIWPIIGPQIEQVMGGGPATWHENALVPITRNGQVENVYWTYSYGPIDDDTSASGVGGVIVICSETTEQVLEAARKAQEVARLSDLFRQAPSFMAVLRGPAHVFEITNDAYLQLIGHRDMVGRPVREALPEVEGQGFFELLDHVYATGEAFVGRGLLANLQRTPGAPLEQRYIDLIYQPVRDADGTISGVFAQGHDITDQKRAEMRAAASEATFRQLAQSMPNHVWTALPNGSLNWFNDQVYAYGGAAPGELDGDKWAGMVHPEDLEAAAAAWTAALGSGEPYQTEFRLRRADGVYRWHIARAVPVRRATGEIESWVGSNTDIEDQKEAEAALRESNLRVRLALSSAEMGVWQCYLEGDKFVDLTGDERARFLFGALAGEQASFSAFAARIHPEDRLRVTPAATAALGAVGDGQLDLDYRVLGEDGAVARWVQVRAKAVEGEARRRLVGTVRDITHRKEAEAQQALLSGELQHRVKNMLAMVSALASQTLRGDDIADRRSDFNARLSALARANDMLMARTWTSAPLRSVLEGAIDVHRHSERQFFVSGPDIDLSPKQTLSVALAAHELATNASKYGALSTEGGRVLVTWAFGAADGDGQERFEFVWREEGGPHVVKPERLGFGSRLITQVLPADFGGEIEIDYAPDGVVCTLTAPAENVTRRGQSPPETAPG